MKLEIGKEYKTRNGLKVKIYDITENMTYPVIVGLVKGNFITPKVYTQEGRYFYNRTGDLDIIGEWQEPLEFDWSCLPPWANEYVAMDRNEEWTGYSIMPKKSEKNPVWLPAEESGLLDFVVIPKEYAPKNFKGNWKDSLFKNPNK